MNKPTADQLAHELRNLTRKKCTYCDGDGTIEVEDNSPSFSRHAGGVIHDELCPVCKGNKTKASTHPLVLAYFDGEG